MLNAITESTEAITQAKLDVNQNAMEQAKQACQKYRDDLMAKDLEIVALNTQLLKTDIDYIQRGRRYA